MKMFTAPDSRFLVPYDGSFRVADMATSSPDADEKSDEKRLRDATEKLDVLQQALFARRILTGTSSDPQVLRIMPPLTISVQEADLLLTGLREVLT